ncbi:MAG TPA: hypothetical protein VKT28_02345 [Puia sp.]|nr:hypothetical protein [Puia sp.]
MAKKLFGKDILIILIVFLISRVIVRAFGIHFGYLALYQYWQYLDVETLKHNLLIGVWYDHAQPPGFNLFLGVVLKLFGSHAPFAFNIILKAITLINVFLLLNILKQLIPHKNLPLIICLLYLLSPATMILETELFYTIFISFLLLLSIYFLLRFQQTQNLTNSFFIFLPLALLCLTRSMYHLAWLIVISIAVVAFFRNRNGFNKLIASACVCLLLVTGWYAKNYFVFGSFSTSTWIGMNFSRNVFHDNEIQDSSRIEAYEAFSKISFYKKFISGDLEKKFSGINDRDLLNEFKNDTFINENHISYIEVSKKYMDASKEYIKTHPTAYLKNVLQSTIIFFTPATRYPLAEEKAGKIKYYDAVYSFNLSQFAEGKQQRRIALTISSLPKFIIYFAVFFMIIRSAIRNKKINSLNLFIMLTIAFVFFVSSLFEHYENMRFRYEIEPLFLILLAQAIAVFLMKEKQETQNRI